MTNKKQAASLKGTKLEPKGEVVLKKNPVRKISLLNFKQAEFARQFIRILPDETHTIKDMLRLEYWAHISTRLQIGDRIEAFWDDSSRFAEFIVLDVGPQWAKVALLSEVDLTKKVKEQTPGATKQFEVKWGGNLVKYTVLRLSDKVQVSKDHATRESAEKWIAQHNET